MTTLRGTVKNGELVFSAQSTQRLGLQEGEWLDLPEAVVAAVREQSNPFLAWIGTLPPLPDGQDAVSFTRQMRDGRSDGDES